MVKDLMKASRMELAELLNAGDQKKSGVIWIRDITMTQQIFMSDGFELIWQQDPQQLFESPLLWFDFLNPENKMDYMKQLEARHNQNYRDSSQNAVWYQITRPDQTIACIQCICYRCVDLNKNFYVVGLAEQLTDSLWQQAYSEKTPYQSDYRNETEKRTFDILKKNFGITTAKPLNTTNEIFNQFWENVQLREKNRFTKRELECVYHLCLGKSAKLIARDLSVSPRTVEIHLDNVRMKLNYEKRLQLVSHFSSMIPMPV